MPHAIRPTVIMMIARVCVCACAVTTETRQKKKTLSKQICSYFRNQKAINCNFIYVCSFSVSIYLVLLVCRFFGERERERRTKKKSISNQNNSSIVGETERKNKQKKTKELRILNKSPINKTFFFVTDPHTALTQSVSRMCESITRTSQEM